MRIKENIKSSKAFGKKKPDLPYTGGIGKHGCGCKKVEGTKLCSKHGRA